MEHLHDSTYASLEKSPLFKGLKNETIAFLLSKVHFQLKQYDKNEIIAYSGDPCQNLYVLSQGSVRGEMIDFTGKTIKIEDIEAPRPLAPAFLFGKMNQYPVTIAANEETAMLVLPKDSVLKLLQMDLVFLKNYMDIISNRAQFLSKKIRFLSFQSIKGKFAHYVLSLTSGSNQNSVLLPKTQAEMADLFGVARPSLARAIRSLDADGIISAKGKEVAILDKRRLSSYLRNES